MSTNSRSSSGRWWLAAIILTMVVVGGMTFPRWQPLLQKWTIAGAPPHAADPHDPHDGHDHGHGHGAGTALELSPQALKNLGLGPEHISKLTKRQFQRAANIPAMVVELPGRTHLSVSTPLTGIIERVHAVQGEAVLPGVLLFEIRLTHEDLVQAQVEYLKLLGELDVVRKEITRLGEAAKSGTVPERTLLEQSYAQQKLVAAIDAQKESLALHGLSAAQIEGIAANRRLLKELQVRAPAGNSGGEDSELRLSSDNLQPVSLMQADSPPLVVHELTVHPGQSISAGETLCTLADLQQLYLQGSAFERDEGFVLRALEQDWQVAAVFDSGAGEQRIDGLKIHHLADQVDPLTRALNFYVPLGNTLVRDEKDAAGRRFVAWRYRPGQRLQLRVPIEEWKNEFVVPVDAVAREGAENFIFVKSGDHFDRRAVHVKYRDQESVVLADDGSIFPGDSVALRGAHQMQMALKNQSGGAVDPHAGHNH